MISRIDHCKIADSGAILACELSGEIEDLLDKWINVIATSPILSAATQPRATPKAIAMLRGHSQIQPNQQLKSSRSLYSFASLRVWRASTLFCQWYW